ncbi:MAG: hypothetical protein AB1762_06665 [Gemmatimonadota bacterium]
MPNEAMWRAEARTFAAYLGTPRVPAEVADRYQSIVATWDRRGFDAWLGKIAAAGPLMAALADAYARRVRPFGDLRRRLTLMLALLESHGATHALYDRAVPTSPVVAWTLIAWTGSLWALRTMLAFLLLGPVHLVSRLTRHASRS